MSTRLAEPVTGRPYLRLVRPGEVPRQVRRARDLRRDRQTLGLLVLSATALTVVGLIMVLSSSSVAAYSQYGSSFYFLERQAMYAVAGTVAGLACSRLDQRLWQRFWAPLMGLTIVLLFAVLMFGSVSGGSARWIDLGPLTLQPSELAKLAVVAATAALLAKNLRHVHETRRLVLPLIPWLALVTVLIMKQPDLGTTMVIVATVCVLLFVAGARLRVLGVTALTVVGAGLLLILSSGYRRTRFFSFLDPWANAKGSGYQVVQSLLALGSGHLTGVGLGASRQKWMFVPNAHTDFIFAILGEEVGLLGEIVVLALFALFLYAGIRVALMARDPFGRLMAAGIVTWIGFQTIINIACATGLLPVTGIPLPFISYGGSSLIVVLAAVGILYSIGRASIAERDPGGRAAGRRGRRG